MTTFQVDSLPTERFNDPSGWRSVPRGIVKIFIFILLPIPLFRITQGLILYSFILTNSMSSGIDKPFWLRPAAEGWMRPTICFFAVLLPAAGLAIAYHRLAKRFHVSRLWTSTAFVLLAFISASVFCNVQLSDVAGESRICIGAAPSLFGWHTLQGVVPLLLACWFSIRALPRETLTKSM